MAKNTANNKTGYETKVAPIAPELKGKDLAQEVGKAIRVEQRRSWNQALTAALADFIYDKLGKGKSWINIGVKFVEFIAENKIDKIESDEHDKNIAVLFAGVSNMYKDLATREGQDPVALKQIQRKLAIGLARYEKNMAHVAELELTFKEKLELAFATGDSSVIDDKSVEWAPKFLRGTVKEVIISLNDVVHSSAGAVLEAAAKELIDKAPGISAANIEVPAQMIAIRQLAEMYNMHPDVIGTRNEVPFTAELNPLNVFNLLKHEFMRLKQAAFGGKDEEGTFSKIKYLLALYFQFDSKQSTRATA